MNRFLKLPRYASCVLLNLSVLISYLQRRGYALKINSPKHEQKLTEKKCRITKLTSTVNFKFEPSVLRRESTSRTHLRRGRTQVLSLQTIARWPVYQQRLLLVLLHECCLARSGGRHGPWHWQASRWEAPLWQRSWEDVLAWLLAIKYILTSLSRVQICDDRPNYNVRWSVIEI